MDKYEMRRLALKALSDKLGYGGKAMIAAKIGKDSSYVSRMLYPPKKAGRKRIGEDMLELLVRAYPDAFKEIATMSRVLDNREATNYVRVQHIEAEAHMGPGRINEDFPEVVNSVEFTPNYIRSLIGFVPPPGRLKLITGTGDSMSPKILPGETVLVDTGCNTFVGDGLYLVNTGSGQQIKALHERNGYIYVTSMDKALYPDFVADKNTIIGGRVYLIQHLERVS
ncbi:MAG TPA: S24 family peptidase [Xylella fastidiosa subsp. multiplex]